MRRIDPLAMALQFVVRELPLPSFIEESLIIATYIDPAEGLPKELPKKYGIFSGKPESRPNATRLPLIAQVPHVGTRFLQDTQPVTRVTRRAERVRVFEIGRVFRKNAQTPNSDTTVEGFDQPIHIAAIAVGPLVPLQWAAPDQDADFYDVKADLQALLSPLEAQFHPAEHPALHPGRCAAVTLRGQTIGHIGELHPKHRQSWGLVQAPVLFELTLDPVLAVDIPMFKPVSKFPVVQRDLAVVVGQSVTHNQLMQAVFAAPTQGLLRDAVLFDIYQPDQAVTNLSANEKSLAIRLTLGSEESTLTDERIQAVVDSVLSSLTLALQARLR